MAPGSSISLHWRMPPWCHTRWPRVLDNCEHLVAACAPLAQALLHSCPELRLLATSREPLRIPGERPYRVPPLSLPASDQKAMVDGQGSMVHGYDNRPSTIMKS